jgi:hypothetical protein
VGKLLPNKFTNLKTNILTVSSFILDTLKSQNQRIRYYNLENSYSSKFQMNHTGLLSDSLNFLFLLDKINYDLDRDEIILKNATK